MSLNRSRRVAEIDSTIKALTAEKHQLLQRSVRAPTEPRLAFDSRGFILALERICDERLVSRSTMALEIGVPDATMSRMKVHAAKPSVPSLLAMCVWSGLEPLDYFIDHEADEIAA